MSNLVKEILENSLLSILKSLGLPIKIQISIIASNMSTKSIFIDMSLRR
jgi:hypothetical protein